MKRAIDGRGAVAINVITMIGIGPLVTIPLVIAALGGPLALVGWIAGAIVALCDGLVWAELSSRFPGSGGTYVYLRETFGPQRLGRALAFLFNWQFLLYAPFLLATGYIGFANYAAYLYPPLASGLAHDAIALAVGALTIALLYRRTSQVASIGSVLAVAATLTVALVALAGLSHADLSRAFHLNAPIRFDGGLLAGFGSALFVTLYDYVGYADAALLGDEVQRPQRTIPRAILISILIVAVLYVLLQVGVLGVIPWQSLLDAHGQPTAASQYVGSLVVERTWGRAAAIGVTVLVLVTAFASLYGNLLGFSRIPFAAARDGAFLPVFARLHPRKEIPHVALLVVGALSLVASFFTLDQAIAILTAGIVLVASVAQIVALAVLRGRGERAPFRMPLYPLPALVALAGWIVAFVSCGPAAIALGLGWLAVGLLVFLIAARMRRSWPFLLVAFVLAALPFPATAADAGWAHWHASRVVRDRGYPVFEVAGRAFYVYGAAFFYERIARPRWREALQTYRSLGINTLDLYAIWNWHEPLEGTPDFTGSSDPRRDLIGVLKIAHEMGFKIVLRPGPVIRNEWRNGGYPAWLLRRPEYRMPLHDVLEGRYPATATLQNAHAEAAAAEWLDNATHLNASRQWLTDVLHAVAPYSSDVIAIALDDDQGAYLDNDTWPAPHWHAYVNWLRDAVRGVTGPRVPLFINTYETKVPSAAPAWAWGDWYQSDSYRLNEHDLADLDFATGLLATQAALPVMQAEFQAGWLQGADEAAPRQSDPSNTLVALGELLRDGAHGVVNFPLQDTIYPHGWEAPWANWSYAWDAALTSELRASPRYDPTRTFGAIVNRYGAYLARAHPLADAGIIWPPSLYVPGSLTNEAFGAFAAATIATQRDCDVRGLTCPLVDLAALDDRALRRFGTLLLPVIPSGPALGRLTPQGARRIAALRARGLLAATPADVPARVHRPRGPGVTLLLADDGSYAFVVAVNQGSMARTVSASIVHLAHRTVRLGRFTVPSGGVRIIPIGLERAARGSLPAPPARGPAPEFKDPEGTEIASAHLHVVFAPFAGARVAQLDDGSGNAASSIGLLRDAADPAPPASSRDYIAAYTHPIEAGTFNREYACASSNALTTQQITCSYDAPDLPNGGALFSRRLILTGDGRDLRVAETFVPHGARSAARLESISGFAFVPGDTLVRGSRGIAILHGRRTAMLRWRSGDVAHVELRQTRGAELVTLVFSRRSVDLLLAVQQVRDSAEARRLLDANGP